MHSFKPFFILSFISYCSCSYAQTELKGVVKDSTDIIAFANVYLTDQNNKIVTGTTSDEDGAFNLSVKEGNYKLTISFIGYLDWSKNINVTTNQDLGVIVLAQDSSKLDEVVVSAKKPLIERKVDRLVFNVASSEYAKGGTAYEALKITPSVQVRDNNVKIIGRDKLIVTINDRITYLSNEELSDYLKSIPADNILSIEVISTPPSKFDAEGNTGMINIVLKKLENNSWNANLRSTYIQSTYPKGEIMSGYNFHKNKLTFHGSLSYIKGSFKSTGEDQIYYSDQLWTTDFDKRFYSDRFGGRFNLSYNITDNLTVGVQYALSKNKPYRKEENNTFITNYSKRIDSIIQTNAEDDRHRLLNNLNVYTKLKLDSLGRNISLNFASLNYKNVDSRFFNSKTLYRDFTLIPNGHNSNEYNGTQDIHNYIGILDIEHPFKKISLNYGVRFSKTQTDNNLESYDISSPVPILIDNQTNFFKYTEITTAFYITGEKNFGKKWASKIGLRFENTSTEGNSITLNQINKDSYIKFFPTVYTVYSPNNKNSISLSYSRRISRPSFSNLNPFKYYYSPYAYNSGNPFLKPQFNTSLEVDYIYKENLVTSLEYYKENQGFGEVPILNEETKEQYFTYLNYFKNNSIFLSISYRYNKIKWLESNISLESHYFQTDFNENQKITLPKVSGWGFYFSTRNSLILNKDKTFRGEVGFWYKAPETDLIYKDDGYCSLNIGIKFFLLKDKNLQIGVYGNDILHSTERRSTTRNNNIRQVYSSYEDNQQLKLTLSYSFGNKKISSDKRNFGNEDEKSRIN